MGLFGKSKEEKIAEFKEKQSLRNGKELKKLLKLFKENRDKIEKQTGKRPDIDDEKFWNAVDYNKQFDYPVEYYER